jgi:hypothetical protein
MRSIAIGSVLAAAIVLSPMAASAGGNEAAAEALFQEAQKLVHEKKYAEACPKFAESNRLDRGAGTLIHLADCYDKNKQTASAWATYKEAASAAQALGRNDWQKLATTKANALEPKLAKMTIKVTDPPSGLEVTKDGAPLSQASYGLALPVDTGSHEVEAKATGYKPWKTVVTVSKDGEKLDVVVPKLEAAPETATPVATKPDEKPKDDTKPKTAEMSTDDGSGLRTVGYALAGVGVVGIAVGAVTGFMAIGKNNTAKEKCPNEGACADKDGVDANDQAKTFGLYSTIGFGAGAACLIGGVVLILTAPKGDAPKTGKNVQITPVAAANGGGFLLNGAF